VVVSSPLAFAASAGRSPGLMTFTATEFDLPTSPDIRMVVHTPRDE
jgi:hypothetical protein